MVRLYHIFKTWFICRGFDVVEWFGYQMPQWYLNWAMAERFWWDLNKPEEARR